MNRWWDDPGTALAVLERVSDADVAQGVGTAVLGYHGLAKAVCSDLPETLVDPADVLDRLAELDLTPVAKALGTATRPLMGEAAPYYGRKLAEQLHADALQGAAALMNQMRASGVPAPYVRERALEVVGVPVRHLAPYASVAKAAQVPPVVRADAADRTLMLYASHLGGLEATGPVPAEEVEVSKGPRVAFREEEHPRSSDGEFTFKQIVPDERVARMERKRRKRKAATAAQARDARVAEAAAAAREELEQATTPRSLARVLGQHRLPQRTLERRVAGRLLPRRLVQEAAAEQVAAPAPKAKPFVPPATRYAITEEVEADPTERVRWLRSTHYADHQMATVISADVAHDILVANGLTVRPFERIAAQNIDLVPVEEILDGAYDARLYNQSNVILVFDTLDGSYPVPEHADFPRTAKDHGLQLASNSRWVFDFEEEIPDIPSPDAHLERIAGLDSGELHRRVIHVRLANPEDFGDLEIITAKALRLEHWENKDAWVNRNEVGEFAVQGAGHIIDVEREERMARKRRAAKRRRLANGTALQVVAEPEQQVEQRVLPQRRLQRRTAPRVLSRAQSRAVVRRHAAVQAQQAVEAKAEATNTLRAMHAVNLPRSVLEHAFDDSVAMNDFGNPVTQVLSGYVQAGTVLEGSVEPGVLSRLNHLSGLEAIAQRVANPTQVIETGRPQADHGAAMKVAISMMNRSMYSDVAHIDIRQEDGKSIPRLVVPDDKITVLFDTEEARRKFESGETVMLYRAPESYSQELVNAHGDPEPDVPNGRITAVHVLDPADYPDRRPGERAERTR